MKSLWVHPVTLAFLVSIGAAVLGQESGLTIVLNEPAVPGENKANGVATATITVPQDTPGTIAVEGAVRLSSAIEPCASVDPGACTGAENFVELDEDGFVVAYGCSDMMDNDSNGLTDSDDPDCLGVQGWSFSVATDECFGLASATTRGTVADLNIRPGGLRDPEGNFEQTEVVDPANNGGQSGFVTAVVLSLSNPVILPQVGDEVVVSFAGEISHGALAAGAMTDGCLARILDPQEAGLRGSGEPVKSAVTVSGETDVPELCNLLIKIMGEEGPPPPTEAGETGLRINVSSPAATPDDDPGAEPQGGEKVVTWTAEVPVPQAGAAPVPVTATVELISRIRACLDDPANCDGAENFVELDEEGFVVQYGCANMMDDDGDGKTDIDDEDCVGVQGWSVSLITEPCFDVSGATTRGTIADLSIRPPGRRDPEGNFEKTEVVDPSLNGGRQGVVSAAVLSLSNPVIVDQIATEPVLVVTGSIDPVAITAPGEETAPCGLAISDPNDPSTNLRGSGEPVKTAITITGESFAPDRCHAAIVLRGREGEVPGQEFQRGDANDDGRTNIADAPWIIRGLFHAGPPNVCDKAADANDDGVNDSSDAVYVISYLFVDGPTPPPPFGMCGADPTDDSLSCNTTSNCP